jgi:putative spermidine/putrescine transport system ATP-binding protein
VTTVMVTHDRQEALSLSDYVVVMNAGHVEQADEPNDIYDRPASEFVATFVGGMNIVRMPLIREGAATGLRYADVKLYRATEAALTRPYTFVGQVQAVQFMGDAVRVKVLLNDFQTTITADALRINTDRSVFSLHSLIAVELPESAWRTWGAQ